MDVRGGGGGGGVRWVWRNGGDVGKRWGVRGGYGPSNAGAYGTVFIAFSLEQSLLTARQLNVSGLSEEEYDQLINKVSVSWYGD